MQKERQSQENKNSVRKRVVKSTDLKRRLFEVGLQNNCAANAPPILNPIASPKNKMLNKKSTNKLEASDQGSRVLRYRPSNSPN